MPLHASLAGLFAADRPDGVILATPNRLHVEQGLECVAAGIPALIEKPVAHAYAEGLRLCEAAERAGVRLLVGHHRRHSPILHTAVEIVNSGVLGRLVARLERLDEQAAHLAHLGRPEAAGRGGGGSHPDAGRDVRGRRVEGDRVLVDGDPHVVEEVLGLLAGRPEGADVD